MSDERAVDGQEAPDGGEDRSVPEHGGPSGVAPQGAEPGSVSTPHAPVEVALQRSVRIGRIMIAGAVAGALAGMILALLFPVKEGADYELGQAVGVALVFGGVVGLALGALLALLLGIFAKRNRGEALAVQTDVR